MKVGGFVNCVDSGQHPPSSTARPDFLPVFGDAGRHARYAVGAGSLPMGVAVEVDAKSATKQLLTLAEQDDADEALRKPPYAFRNKAWIAAACAAPFCIGMESGKASDSSNALLTSNWGTTVSACALAIQSIVYIIQPLRARSPTIRRRPCRRHQWAVLRRRTYVGVDLSDPPSLRQHRASYWTWAQRDDICRCAGCREPAPP